MKIRKLEIQGFKSFVDRTLLTFDHDITAIVGPNGCGKSNTVDAIRWCMGEQSARHLRGKSMEDVIFSGSDSRAPQNQAEVTLTFDNSDGIAPPEYASYAEIAVTRRLGRDGTSEYLINKTPVRLMDVVSLFLGTGAGTKAYSIVEQGRIGLIVTSKPEDRRALLEEAAGITRYKARKKAAERKIEQTRQNLLRVGDIVTEIEKNLGNLQRQAQKAERYKEYRAELRDIELYLASHRLLELVVLSKLTAQSLEIAEAEHAGVLAALGRGEAETASLQQALFDAEQTLEQAQQASFQADNEATRLQSEIQRIRDQLAAARRREGDATRELDEIANTHAALQRERTELAAELVGLAEHEASAAAEVQGAHAAVVQVRGELQEAEARLNAHRQTISASERTVASSEASRNALSRRKLDVESRLSRLEAEERALQKRQSEIEGESTGVDGRLEKLRAERDEMVLARARLEGEQGPLRAERERVERALGEVKVECDRASARFHALREIAERHDGVGKGVRSVLQLRDQGVAGLVVDSLSVAPEFAQAVAAVLADRWQDVAVDAPERAVGIVGRLRAKDEGRAALVAPGAHSIGAPVVAHVMEAGVIGMLVELIGGESEIPEVLRAALRPVVLVDSLDRAVELRKQQGDVNGDYCYVTREGDVLEPNGRIVGGTPERAGAGLLATHSEIRELEPRVAALQGRVAELAQELDATRKALSEAQHGLDGMRADLHAQELAIVTLERDNKTHEAERSRIGLRAQSLVQELLEARTAVDECVREDAVLATAWQEAQDILASAREGLSADEATVQARRTVAEGAIAKETDVRIVAARAHERAVAARNAVSRLERSEQELVVRQQRLVTELEQLAHTQGAAAAQSMVLREAFDVAVAQAKKLQEVLHARRDRYEVIKHELGEIEIGVRSIRVRKEGLSKTLTQLEMRAREETLAAQHLCDAVAEKHSVVLPRVVSDYHMRPPPEDTERARADELRRLIERMGEVNLTAIEEHAEQQKRFDFFVEQRADLERALAQLEDAIAQMNRESKKRFKETFDAVNANFKQLFPRLFRGGHGSLQMSDPEDLLETGVEIVAQPPGKKLVNLESMSGGEKTLTAVTLLFSLFMHRPSPFCLLDEVEAALDEANVIRLCELVRDLTDRSQFIMITHNKRTMAMADVLYGVTMEEPGVSKLVGVKLRKADAPAAPHVDRSAPAVA